VITRAHQLRLIQSKLSDFPIVAILGARQVGKTTIARQLAGSWDGPVRHFDLEDPDDQARLSDPAFVLRDLKGLVVLDEVQLRPDIFPLLRVLADRPETLRGFSCWGVRHRNFSRRPLKRSQDVWCFISWTGSLCQKSQVNRQGTSGSIAAGCVEASLGRSWRQVPQVSQEWRESFIRTYLERDLPRLRDQSACYYLAALLDDAFPLSRAGMEQQ